MLNIFTLLLLVAYCVGGEETPKLWGSRIVTQAKGSITLDFEFIGTFTNPTLEVDSDIYYIQNDKCVMDNGTVWSAPCSLNGNKASITIQDVQKQNLLVVSLTNANTDQIAYTVVFANDCIFPKPAQDQLVVEESSPLSRFVKGQTTFPLKFAIMGSESTDRVELTRNGQQICEWSGITWKSGDECEGKDLVVEPVVGDSVNKMRVFKKNFSVPKEDSKDVYDFVFRPSILSVTVDGSIAGESPELADCKVTTTSIAMRPSVTQMIGANLALIIALVYFGM